MSEQVQAAVEAAVEKQASESPESTQPQQQPVEQQEAPKSDEFSTKFAALSRRERQLLEREKKLKSMEDEINSKSSSVNSWEEKKKNWKNNPDELLSEAGLTFEELINLKLGIEPEEKQLTTDEIYKKLKEEMDTNFKKLEEEKKQAIEAENAQVLSKFQNDIQSYITTNADKYELINYQGDFDLVFDVIEEYYTKNGEVLEIGEAADHVERHLEGLVDGALKLKKISSKFAPKVEAQPSTESEEKTTAPSQAKISPTLSNELASERSHNSKPLSIEESKKRAAQLLRWG